MSEPSGLERAVIEAIGRQYPEHASGLAAQIATARVTERENTGCGMYLTFEVDPSAPKIVPESSPLGWVSSWIGGLEVQFMVYVKEGLIALIEGFSFGDVDISDVELSDPSFTPLKLVHYEGR
jgi:hypothetical protein